MCQVNTDPLGQSLAQTIADEVAELERLAKL
jgi:hypothetical protein